jgi:hypothetical protein
MMHRWNTGWTAPVALVLTVAFMLAAAPQAGAQTKTMYAAGRGTVQVVRLYDKPDPLGKTMERVLPGTEIKVLTDQLYNKYWYKTETGLYAHIRYLSETNPMAEDVESESAPAEADPERESELLAKYTDMTIVKKILSHQIDIGFTMDQVIDSWGEPYDRKILESTSLGDRWQWRYEADKKAYLIFDERKKLVEIRADKR